MPDLLDNTITYKAIDSLMYAGSEPCSEDPGVGAIQWRNGYGLMGTHTENGTTYYDYVYAGYDWTYCVNGYVPTDGFYADGTPIQLYMDQCEINNNDIITLNYDLVIEYWTADYNLFY